MAPVPVACSRLLTLGIGCGRLEIQSGVVLADGQPGSVRGVRVGGLGGAIVVPSASGVAEAFGEFAAVGAVAGGAEFAAVVEVVGDSSAGEVDEAGANRSTHFQPGTGLTDREDPGPTSGHPRRRGVARPGSKVCLSTMRNTTRSFAGVRPTDPVSPGDAAVARAWPSWLSV